MIVEAAFAVGVRPSERTGTAKILIRAAERTFRFDHINVGFAQNRRMRGLYQSAVPSRFVDELPEAHVDVVEAKSPFGGAYQNFGGPGAFGRQNPYGKSRFDDKPPAYDSTYQTPGWQRAQARAKQPGSSDGGWNPAYGGPAKPKFQVASGGPPRRAAKTIEGQLVASSTAQNSDFRPGDRVIHQKLGPGVVVEIDGNKLTIEFDEVGRKRVVDSWVEKAG